LRVLMRDWLRHVKLDGSLLMDEGTLHVKF
jgi:hypothetical protein